jgi:hypothetical protein
MFNENSGLVQVWLRLIKSGTYTIEQVPNISNLREVINRILNM